MQADYIFLPNHSFQNISIKIRDNTNRDMEKYLFENTAISVI
jgi:hypothetical protein